MDRALGPVLALLVVFPLALAGVAAGPPVGPDGPDAAATGGPDAAATADRGDGGAAGSASAGARGTGRVGGEGSGSDPEAGTAGAPAARDPPTRSVVGNRTPERLGLGPGTPRTAYAAPRSNLAASVGAGDAGLRARYGLALATRRIETADNRTERRRALATALDGIERRLERLTARERVAIRAYANGTRSTRDLLWTLVRIDAAAGALRASLADLVERTDLLTTRDARYNALRNGLRSLESPVRDRLADAVTGRADRPLVHVAATGDGLVLQAVVGDRYVREAVRLDNRVPGDDDTLRNAPDLQARAGELYPWASSRTETLRIDGRVAGGVGNDSPQLSLVTIPHPQGQVVAYLDDGTAEVAREVQTLRLARVPLENVTNLSRNGVSLTVQRTAGGNPVRVVATVDGRPADVPVVVEGRTVGRTGADGVLWTVGPPGRYGLSVVTDRAVLNATVGA